jgi:pSer/pThr/pTyr-binding forkhead associated (FHA) protein
MAFLQILTGDAKGQKVDIDRDRIIIGRSPDNVAVINDPSVSGKHCVIIREGRRFTVRDLDSTNGTKLNNVAIKECRLSPKDIVTAGSVEVVFDGDDVEPDEDYFAPATETQITVRRDTAANLNTLGIASSFEARRSNKHFLVVVIGVITVFVVGTLGWILYNLFCQ